VFDSHEAGNSPAIVHRNFINCPRRSRPGVGSRSALREVPKIGNLHSMIDPFERLVALAKDIHSTLALYAITVVGCFVVLLRMTRVAGRKRFDPVLRYRLSRLIVLLPGVLCGLALILARRETRVGDAQSKPSGGESKPGGVIVAMDDFESDTDGADLNGSNGGVGWGGPWISR
jgi:hypothetical protein